MGGGKIVLRINEKAVAYGDCNKIISDGRFVMTYNPFTAENGFESPMEWLPDFLEALISGTPIPMISSYKAAVTLRNKEQVYLSKEGQICLASKGSGIPRENLLAELRSKMEDMDYELLDFSTDGTLFIQFVIPEGDTRNEKIAETMSRTIKALNDEIYTYGIRVDFLAEDGDSYIRFYTSASSRRNDMRMRLWGIYYNGEVREEIEKLLNEDETIANFVSIG